MKCIPELHALFCAITAMPLRLDPYRERCWFDWQRNGWTGEDLKLVVDWIKRKNKAGGHYKLTFTKLIVETDIFEERLGEARAQARKPVISAARASILRASGRSDVPPSKEAVQAGERALAILRECRANL